VPGLSRSGEYPVVKSPPVLDKNKVYLYVRVHLRLKRRFLDIVRAVLGRMFLRSVVTVVSRNLLRSCGIINLQLLLDFIRILKEIVRHEFNIFILKV